MSFDTDENGYNDSNRAFLQAFLARGSMTFAEARPVLAAIFSVQEGQPTQAEDVTEDDLASYIAAANTAISPFDLEIRSTLRQTTSTRPNGDDGNGTQEIRAAERVYALVNTTSDALTQLASIYSADEIAFVKRVLDAMFDTHNTRRSEAMVVTGIQAMQLAKAASGSQGVGGAAQSLPMSQAESVMKQLVDEGWFEKSRKGFYSLSPRALLELRGWLVATYNDDEDEEAPQKIKFCAACRDIITVGQRCGNRDCSGRLHDMCVRNFFRAQKAEQCPACKAPWPGDKFVGERAITTSEQYQQGKRRSTNTQQQGNREERPTAAASTPDQDDAEE
ncbi:hypothetical protein ASPZODRAFT_1137948 [Penicilliopsis zonata CBS 506.65]|uniref:Non-structural maintenance of chromosomes element 1 homolog n=1 Tax=Penicilliopsis zonata CBS 506.65 TaxID=1073090 RepID=A0A1L9SSV0_9EURO|nr:hypothetical protein ASPZODRAFT_1137948 [Penicilliopsis zonata CBS 506.65]OJJ50275.1 hypothetical protein ASPZODRAFT_1137948 [Penicilliopsis zonata CBS 506.65]